jgi:hypothetical protein
LGIRIYIGSNIEHASERALLEALYHGLAGGDTRSAIILGNVNLGGRQIDAIAIREDLILVLEAKAFARAVRGTSNGQWEVQLASGQWKKFSNPWIQVVEAKNALRDAMRLFAGATGDHYPEAAVVFVPDIPGGSTITAGDFKASVIGLSALG